MLYALVVLVLIIFLAVFFAGRSTQNYSEVFLQSYSKTPIDKQVSFSFSIADNEGVDADYSYKVFFGNDLLFEKNVFVKNSESVLVLS